MKHLVVYCYPSPSLYETTVYHRITLSTVCDRIPTYIPEWRERLVKQGSCRMKWNSNAWTRSYRPVLQVLTEGQIRFHGSVVERSKKSTSTATILMVEIVVTTHHYFITSRVTAFFSTLIATNPPLDSQAVVFFEPLRFFNDFTVAFPLKQ